MGHRRKDAGDVLRRIDEATERDLAERVPSWVEAVRRAKSDDAKMILTLDAFADDPQLLYDAMWLAHSSGVTVIVASL